VPEFEAPILGRDFGRILSDRGLDAINMEEGWPEILLRAHTDGSLFDAMRFVTGTHRGPDYLLQCDPDEGVEPTWDEKLAAISNERLRDALRHLCRTGDSARAYGGYYLGVEDPHFKEVPHFKQIGQVVAVWRFGEGQGYSAVVQLP
jgi:hypothetical protein